MGFAAFFEVEGFSLLVDAPESKKQETRLWDSERS